MKDNITIAGLTDTGRLRQLNEDSLISFDCPNGKVVVVCDGMGGQNAGDLASQLAVTVIKDILGDNTFNNPSEAIVKSMTAANQAILHRASRDENLTGMGSTCVMIIIKDNIVYYGSVGDSRIYTVINGNLRQLTKDQSYVQTLVDAGEITMIDAEHHQDKNQITNALGIEGMTPPVVGQIQLLPGHDAMFLLCSDGLSGMVSNNIIMSVLADKTMSLQDKAGKLIELANESGGLDNITVQLVEYHDAEKNTNALAGKRAEVRKNKTFTNYLIVAVVFCLIVGGLAFWFIYNSKQDDNPKKETPVVVKPSTPSVPKETETVKEKVIVVEKEVQKAKPTSKIEEPASKKITGKNGGKVTGKGNNIIPQGNTQNPVPPESKTEEKEIKKVDYSKEK